MSKKELRDALDGLAFAAHQCGESRQALGDDGNVTAWIWSAMEWAELMSGTTAKTVVLGPPPVGCLTDGEHALLMNWAENFATVKLVAERERCIAWLDEEQNRRVHRDNIAGVFAQRMREDLIGAAELNSARSMLIEIERLRSDRDLEKKLRKDAEDDREELIVAAVYADRERICLALPGGGSVDPQCVAAMVRDGTTGLTT